jgi:hypothetical protein
VLEPSFAGREPVDRLAIAFVASHAVLGDTAALGWS